MFLSDEQIKAGNDTVQCDDWLKFQKNIPVVVIFSIFVITGVVGNSLILYIYGRHFKSTTTRVFILSLAVFDLITCVSLPYKIVLLRYAELFKNDDLARLEILRLYFLQVSAMILPLVSIDRHRRICTPHKTQISPKVAKLLVLGVSVLIGLLNVFRMIVTNGECYRAEAFISPTYLKQDYENSWLSEFYFAYVALPFIVPLPILIIMYSLVGYKVRQMSRKPQGYPRRSAEQPRETPQGSLRVTKRGNREQSRRNAQDQGSVVSEATMNECTRIPQHKKSRANGYRISVTQMHSKRDLNTRSLAILLNSLEARRTEDEILEKMSRHSYPCVQKDRIKNHNSVVPDATSPPRDTEGDSTPENGNQTSVPPTRRDTDSSSTRATISTTNNTFNTPQSTSVVETRLPWKRMTMIFFLITLIYIIAMLPFFTIFLIFRFNYDYGHKLLSEGGFIILYDLVYITVVSNCFLYGFFDPRFQKELKLLKIRIWEKVYSKYRLCDSNTDSSP